MSKIRAVLFDLDGTLRDTHDLIYDTLDYTFAAHKLAAPTKEELAPHIQHLSFIHQAHAKDIPYQDFRHSYHEHFDAHLDDIELYPYAKAILEQLHEKYLIGIVTSATNAAQELLENEISRDVDLLVSGSDVPRPKPDPAGIQLALERLQLDATEAVYVGDLRTDVMAAHAAELSCIAITHGFGTRESLEAAGADHIIDSLSELPELVAHL